MVNIPILAGVALVMAGGTSLAAGFGAFDDWAGDGRECPYHVDVPLSGSRSGTLRMTFNNSVGDFHVRACAFDADGLQRVDEEFGVPVSDAHTVDLPVPQGDFLLVVQIQTSEGHADLRSLIDTTGCLGHAIAKDFPVGRSSPPATSETQAFESNETHPRPPPRPFHSSVWFGLRPATCAASGHVVERDIPDGEGSSMGFDLDSLRGAPGVSLGSVFTVAGFMTLGVAASHPFGVGAVALFSRLARPRLLDQPTRSRMVDLVEAQPGIRFHEIATTLGLGQGVALHHLRVLLREKLVCRVGKSFFLVGKFGRDEMASMTALRSPAARAMFGALHAAPRTAVSDLAWKLRVTPSWAAKVIKRLEEAGLVVRSRKGRACIVSVRKETPADPV